MNKNFYQYMSLPCINLHPHYYCPENNLIDEMKTNDCVFQLLQLKNTHVNCQYTPVQISQVIIQEIDQSHYIGIFPNQTKLKTICTRTDFTILQGSYLIELPPKCSFETNDVGYYNEKQAVKGQPMLLPKINVQNHQIPINTSTIKIEDIPLDKIHEIQKKQKQMAPVTLLNPDGRSINYWIILPCLLIGIIGTYLLLDYLRRRRMTTAEPPSATSPAARGNNAQPFFNP